jgi:hypothetical protein
MFTHLTKTCPYFRDKVYRTYQGLQGVLMTASYPTGPTETWKHLVE